MNKNEKERINYLAIAITTNCNYKCFYCKPTGENIQTNLKGTINFESIKKIIKVAYELGITIFRITGGEPTMVEYLPELINYIMNLGENTKIRLNTNGYKLNNILDIIEHYKERIDIVISVDSVNEYIHGIQYPKYLSPEIKKITEKLGFDYDIDTHEKIFELLKKSLVEEPPISIKEGYMIKTGFNSELDELREIRSGGKDFVAAFEAKVKEETGIKSLKVGFNKVFGYFIEIPNGSKNLVKEEYRWERRQTLTNCERYISPALKEKESMILNAEENIIDLEYKLFCDIKEIVKKEVPALNKTADALSEIDALTSLSVCSEEYSLVRPILTNDHIIDIKNGRHPVVEVVSKSEYVPNDCVMDNGINTLLITGPNMSGKSTFMRQLAIIVIMAQMGSFVPCEAATLPIIDKIFTRIGASDDLVSGESTFMVEMKEARNAIDGATENSLILFDELGRGTATYDGMSLAQAILEYISENIGAFTLFSTHYHELTRLDKKFKNVHVSAVENGNQITFLHKVKTGAVDKSYGIHVARLAKMPDELLDRAEEILSEYESNSKKKNPEEKVQLAMNFEPNVKKDDIIKETIDKIDVLNTTPMEALNILFDLKQKIKKGE